MQRLLVKTSNTIEAYFYVGETLTDATGPVSVNVYDVNGVLIAGPTNATDAVGTGHYTYQLQSFNEVTRIKVTWTGTFGGSEQTITQFYEIVGAFLFSLAALRNMEGILGDADHTTDELVVVREQVTDLFNDYTHTAFGETFMRETIDGRSLDFVTLDYLPVRRVLSAKLAGTAVTPVTVSSAGILTRTGYWSRGFQNVVIDYVYGHEHVPGDVNRAALRLARSWLLSSDSSMPDRARMMTTEWGSFQLTVANADFPTGLPEVDAVLNRYKMTLPGLA